MFKTSINMMLIYKFNFKWYSWACHSCFISFWGENGGQKISLNDLHTELDRFHCQRIKMVFDHYA